jgi:hypothetical protein
MSKTQSKLSLLWYRFGRVPDYARVKAKKWKQRNNGEWEKSGELKGIRTIDKRFIKK